MTWYKLDFEDDSLMTFMKRSALDTVLDPKSSHAHFAGFWCILTGGILFNVLPVSTISVCEP